MNPDYINGTFELFGALALFQNVRAMHRDRKLRGVSWMPVAFFFTWGLWNLFYYPYLDQWASFFGGALVSSVNAYWLGQVVYFRAWRN